MTSHPKPFFDVQSATDSVESTSPKVQDLGSEPRSGGKTADLNIAAWADQLEQWLARFPRIIVAFSGGVDSSVVAAAAMKAAPDSIAITALSPSVASWQKEAAAQIATDIGIEHQWLTTHEVDLPEYRRNDHRRCFHCKSTLYQAIESIVRNHHDHTIVSGTNHDDLGDYRPGLEAGSLAGVKTPLADLQINKHLVRQLAVHYGLKNHAAPASPCLASRIAYGVEVTPERLEQVDRAEAWIRNAGFTDVRVRCEPGNVARVEVPLDEVQRLVQRDNDGTVGNMIRSYGFERVTIDPRGLRSGNLNEALIEQTVGPLITLSKRMND